MKTFIVCIFCCCALHAFSQDSIIIHKDSRLDILNAKQASLNKIASRMTSSGLYRGYRLQVLNTRRRDEAYQMKADLLQRFPEQKTYVLFQSPYFKIRFGNFTVKADALRYKSSLSAIYPQVIYVVSDNVEYNAATEDANAD